MTASVQDISRQEWELVLQLLERERMDLVSEIRRCHNLDMRDELHRRQRAIIHLIEQLSPANAYAGAGI